MDRRKFLAGLAVTSLAAPAVSRGQGQTLGDPLKEIALLVSALPHQWLRVDIGDGAVPMQILGAPADAERISIERHGVRWFATRDEFARQTDAPPPVAEGDEATRNIAKAISSLEGRKPYVHLGWNSPEAMRYLTGIGGVPMQNLGTRSISILIGGVVFRAGELAKSDPLEEIARLLREMPHSMDTLGVGVDLGDGPKGLALLGAGTGVRSITSHLYGVKWGAYSKDNPRSQDWKYGTVQGDERAARLASLIASAGEPGAGVHLGRNCPEAVDYLESIGAHVEVRVHEVWRKPRRSAATMINGVRFLAYAEML